MGNIQNATVDGHPIGTTLRQWGRNLLSVLSPFSQLYESFRPPLNLQVEKAASKIQGDERRRIITTLEADRHELSNAISQIEDTMVSITTREQALTAQLSEVEQERARYADALSKYEQSWRGGGLSTEEDVEQIEHDSTLEEERRKATELRRAVDETLPDLHTDIHHKLVSLREDYRRLEDKFERLNESRNALVDNLDIMREAEEANRDDEEADDSDAATTMDSLNYDEKCSDEVVETQTQTVR